MKEVCVGQAVGQVVGLPVPATACLHELAVVALPQFQHAVTGRGGFERRNLLLNIVKRFRLSDAEEAARREA